MPGMAYTLSFFANSMPDWRRAFSVMAMYALDSSFPVTVSVLSVFKSGSANRSPEINCEDTLPAISNSPPVSLPEQ